MNLGKEQVYPQLWITTRKEWENEQQYVHDNKIKRIREVVKYLF